LPPIPVAILGTSVPASARMNKGKAQASVPEHLCLRVHDTRATGRIM